MNLSVKGTSVSTRNYGIDFLRLVAAFYVIILHTVNQGGIYQASSAFIQQNQACRLLLVFSFCAVNIFGIVSGYVGYRENQRKLSYSGYFPLWLTVVFYSVLLSGIFMYILPGAVTRDDLITSFFPVTKNLYWYFSAYTLVYFLAPFLNTLVFHSSDRDLKLLFLLICVVFTVIEYLAQSFAMGDGYSTLWLLLLYLIGAIMKKTGLGSRIPSFAAVSAILLINLSLFLCNIRRPEIPVFIFRISFEINDSYVKPLYLASAILHVILFSRLQFRTLGQKIIRFAAPAAFSVYIVNTQRSFWNLFMMDRFVSWASISPLALIGRTIGFSLVFVLCIVLLDYFRQMLFRLLKVGNLIPALLRFLRKDGMA